MTSSSKKDNLEALLEVLGDHPLSIELVGPHLKQLTPEQIVARFHELLAQFTGDAEVERNRSLLASLRFSTSRLSAKARAALPWLGLFQDGVFEEILLEVSQIDPTAWDGVRAELEATALVRVETDIDQLPYLHFHPTLPYAVGRAGLAGATARQADADDGRLSLADQKDVHQRFIAVYDTWTVALERPLRSSAARGGMDVLARQEANVRTAVRLAVGSDQFEVAARMVDTFSIYLECSARLRERDQLSAWLADAAAYTTFSAAVAGAERDRAWSLFTQGHVAEAVQMSRRPHWAPEADRRIRCGLSVGRCTIATRSPLRPCRSCRAGDPDFETGSGRLGAARGELANLAPSETIEDLLTSKTQEAKQRREACFIRLNNLAAALTELADALSAAGRLDEALRTVQQSFDISYALGLGHELSYALRGKLQSLCSKDATRRPVLSTTRLWNLPGFSTTLE